MSDSSQRREIDAFFNFFATFNLARPVTTVADLADGAALFDVLSIVYVVNSASAKLITHPRPSTAMRTTSVNPRALQRSHPRTGFSGLAPLSVSTVS